MGAAAGAVCSIDFPLCGCDAMLTQIILRQIIFFGKNFLFLFFNIFSLHNSSPPILTVCYVQSCVHLYSVYSSCTPHMGRVSITPDLISWVGYLVLDGRHISVSQIKHEQFLWIDFKLSIKTWQLGFKLTDICELRDNLLMTWALVSHCEI